jgi:pimeloyl-ACP methyl ester carboxylesterase
MMGMRSNHPVKADARASAVPCVGSSARAGYWERYAAEALEVRMRHDVLSLFAFALAATSFSVSAGPPQITPPDYDEVFPVQYITQGAPAKSKAECDATPNAVWVTAKWLDQGALSASTETTTECIRYFPSGNSIGARTAILFFSGDIVLERGAGDNRANPGYRANSYEAQIVIANQQSTSNGAPYIHVARPGMYGSTGNTATHRHSAKEAATMNAAVDAIKVALSYDRVSIVGQSGGGGIVGALLTSGRTDLECVVIASGSVSLKTSLKTTKSKSWVRNGQDTTGLPYRQLYDSLDYLGNVKADANRRVFMLSDPEDEAVSYLSQKEFADRANETGIPVRFINAKGGGKQHHVTSVQGIRTVGRCLDGMSDDEIAAKAAENAPALFSIMENNRAKVVRDRSQAVSESD